MSILFSIPVATLLATLLDILFSILIGSTIPMFLLNTALCLGQKTSNGPMMCSF